MSLTDTDFASILDDRTKRIQGAVVWKKDEDRSFAWEFRVEVESTSGWPLFVQGRYNSTAGTLTYTLILKSEGRIYGLDLGKDHHNPNCNQVGERHMHRWSEKHGDKEAHVPNAVKAHVSNPVAVWEGVLYGSQYFSRWQDGRATCHTGGIVVMDGSHLCQGDTAKSRSLVHVLGAGRLSSNSHSISVSRRRQHRPFFARSKGRW